MLASYEAGTARFRMTDPRLQDFASARVPKKAALIAATSIFFRTRHPSRMLSCLGTTNGRRGYVYVPGSLGTSVCE
jgi:hypothetical protein